jgi:DnaJ-domain-containing protein 1
MSQGLPEQALLLAKERTQDIQAAWDLIKSHQKWK